MARIKGNPECQDCGLYRSAQAVCLMGRGPIPCDIMIIGEAPGFREDEIGKPFQGKAGQLLDQLLKQAGLNRDTCFITNTCRCRPPDNRTPTPQEIKACASYLELELDTVKPKYVLMLGATALKGVLGKGKITEIHGQVIEKDGVFYMPTFHPAAALRDPKRREPLEADISRFSKLVKEGKTNDGPKLDWTEIRDFDSFNECVADIQNSSMISFDLETTDLNRHGKGETINCIGIATPQKQWILPVDMNTSPFRDKKELQQTMIEILVEAAEGKKVIGHNGKFDNLWLRKKFGVSFHLTFDTMLASHLLDENTPNNLKYLARVFCGAPNYDLTTPEKKGSISPKKLYKYCATDVFYTLQLYQIFRERLKGDKTLLKIYKSLTMPAARMFEEVESEGVFLHLEKLDLVETDLLNKLGEIETELTKHTPDKTVNWNSPKQVAEVLFQDWKLKPVQKTKTGADSTGESVLKALVGQHPGIELLLKQREHFKLYSGFVKGWKKRMYKGRIYPSYKLHGTVTGRLSCVDPNLQQVPRESSIRSLIGSPPGWTFVEVDYSQIELRIVAMLSGEPTMKFVFQTGGDIHTETAISVTGKTEISKEERKKAKAVNFGFVYGMGWRKFKEYAFDKYGVVLTDGEAKTYRTRYFEKYSRLPQWHDKQRRLARTKKQVRNLIGRIRRLPEVDSPEEGVRAEAERQAINSPVQGFGCDLSLMGAIEVYEEFPWKHVKIVGQVHDALLMLVKTEYLDKYLPKIKKIMESPKLLTETFQVNPTVPIVVDIKYGNAWGAGTEWQPPKSKPENKKKKFIQ